MPFIRAQKVKRDASGRVTSGSASVVDVEYVPGARCHSRQRVRERLGKVVELAEDGRSEPEFEPPPVSLTGRHQAASGRLA